MDYVYYHCREDWFATCYFDSIEQFQSYAQNEWDKYMSDDEKAEFNTFRDFLNHLELVEVHEIPITF